MKDNNQPKPRIVKAVHGSRENNPDEQFELELSNYLRNHFSLESLIEQYSRFSLGESPLDFLMRRAFWRAAARRIGHGLQIGSGVGFKHFETFDIGNNVFIGSQSYIQGRFDGRCIIGDNVWIGPQSYFDARDIIIGDYVGWGPGAKVLGSEHTGVPLDVPIIQTDLEIKSVRIEDWADIGVNAVILPGITIGKGSQIGAGAIVTKDVPPFAIAVGIPARIIGWRKESIEE